MKSVLILLLREFDCPMAVAKPKPEPRSPANAEGLDCSVPRKSPCARMKCHDLLFMHWPIHACHLVSLLPAGIELDTFEGQAWIGIVPFRMSDVTSKWMPPLPWISRFPEVVVRTCVSFNGRPGLWYFSLDAANRLAMFLARCMFALPYSDSHITLRRDGHWRRFHSRRIEAGETVAELDVEYRPVGPASVAESGTLDHWLTDRYCLFTTNREDQIVRGDFAHPPWRLQKAQAIIHRNTMVNRLGLALPDQCPRLLFAKQSPVSVWRNRPGE